MAGGKCPKCEELKPELGIAAYSYVVAGEHLDKDGELPIFFVQFDFDQSRKGAFTSLGVDRVPAVGISTPEMSKASQRTYRRENFWLITNDGNVEAQKTLENINNLFKKDVQLSYTLLRILTGNILLIGLASVAFFGRNIARKLLMIKMVWYWISAIAFIACVGGTAYNMIHGVPNFRQAQDPNTGEIYIDEYFQRNMRAQWAGEGYLASLCFLATALSFLSLFYIDKWESDYKKYVHGAISIGLIMVFTFLVSYMWSIKVQFDTSFWPPEHYIKGSLLNDQGITV